MNRIYEVSFFRGRVVALSPGDGGMIFRKGYICGGIPNKVKTKNVSYRKDQTLSESPHVVTTLVDHI